MALTLPEIENLRRSVAMLPAESPSGLKRAKALEVLAELAAVTTERDRLLAELAALASLEEMLTQRHLAREPRPPEDLTSANRPPTPPLRRRAGDL